MSQILKNLKELIKAEKFVLIFIVLISSMLIYLLVKSPTIKTTTEIQLDNSELVDSIIQVDTIVNDTTIQRIGE